MSYYRNKDYLRSRRRHPYYGTNKPKMAATKHPSVTIAEHKAKLLALYYAMEADKGANLTQKNIDFAKDLLAKSKKFVLTGKQMDMVEIFTNKAKAVKDKVETVAIGDMKGIKDLFANVAAKLQYPKIVLSYVPNGAGSRDDASVYKNVVIKVAGPNASQPGTLNIASEGNYGSAIWYGRVQDDGTFEKSTRHGTVVPNELISRLKDFAADPAKVAADHGKLTGRCCFCNKHLDDERSTNMGYGPVCAKNYKLPWGKK